MLIYASIRRCVYNSRFPVQKVRIVAGTLFPPKFDTGSRYDEDNDDNKEDEEKFCPKDKSRKSQTLCPYVSLGTLPSDLFPEEFM